MLEDMLGEEPRCWVSWCTFQCATSILPTLKLFYPLSFALLSLNYYHANIRIALSICHSFLIIFVLLLITVSLAMVNSTPSAQNAGVWLRAAPHKNVSLYQANNYNECAKFDM